ncbi:nucleotide exchange factor GrpE [Candidatus Woesebacteria bacterium]|nr:nucleotide exchange factor GrpE [Candidatus Woesebacteria bacterium]
MKKKKDELTELKNQLARALADYDNLRKRTELEKGLWVKFAGERILTKLLPILDNFESAQSHLNDQGLAIAIGGFKKVLTEEGLEEIRPKPGDEFDANIHEAIEVIKNGQEGKISEAVLVGWKFREGFVIRHAKVKVYGKDSRN